jgi:hypothetical protein
MYMFWASEALEGISDRYRRYSIIMERFRQEIGNSYLRVGYQAVLNLMNRGNTHACNLIGEVYTKAHHHTVQSNNYILNAFCYDLFSLALHTMFRHKQEALQFARSGFASLDGAIGLLLVAEFHYFSSISLLENWEQTTEQERQHVVATIGRCNGWAINAPLCFQHKAMLLQAMYYEFAESNFLNAVDLFDAAIEGARKYGFVQDAAIACEITAEFYRRRGKPRIANDYILEAYHNYIRWGAEAKTKDMALKYPNLIVKLRREKTFGNGDQGSVSGESILPISPATSGSRNKVVEPTNPFESLSPGAGKPARNDVSALTDPFGSAPCETIGSPVASGKPQTATSSLASAFSYDTSTKHNYKLRSRFCNASFAGSL